MYLENEKGKIYYEVHAEKDGAPAVLFSHGVCMDHKTFLSQVEVLKKHYTVIVWDMPFHGNSSPLNTKGFYTASAADFIKDLLDQTQTDKAVLVGLSLGSFVVQQAVHKYPERVAGTVHIGGGSLYPGYPSILKLFNPIIGFFIALYPSRSIFKTFAKHRALKPETRAYMEKTATKTGKGVMAHLTQEMLRDMVKGLRKPSNEPMLLLYGDHETSFVKKTMQKMHHNNPNSQIMEVKDAHHVANQDNPEKVNEILLSFLTDLHENI